MLEGCCSIEETNEDIGESEHAVVVYILFDMGALGTCCWPRKENISLCVQF